MVFSEFLKKWGENLIAAGGVVHAQLSWICTNLIEQRAADLFSLFFGVTAENSQTLQAFDANAGGFSVAANGEDGTVTQVVVNANRIDVMLGLPGGGDVFDGPIFLDDSNGALDRMETLATVIDERMAQFTPYRLAVVIKLRTEALDSEVCRQIVSDVTGVASLAGAVDVHAGFNVKQPIDGTDYIANQIVRWSQSTDMRFAEANVFGGVAIPTGQVVEACTVVQDIDVNTAPVPRMISLEDRLKIWPSLIAKARAQIQIELGG